MYKYCSRENLARLLESGSVRFGTLWEYRNQELLGGSIGDEMEGRILSGDGPRNLPLGGIPGFIEVRRGAEGSIQDVGFAIQHVGFDRDDAFVFSLAKQISSEAAARWLRDEKAKYDAAYKVTNVEAFARALGMGLAAEVGPVVCRWGEVTYYDSAAPDWECFGNIEFSKPAGFSWQVEYRIVFYPQAPSSALALESKILEVPALRRLVSPRALPEN